MISFRSPQDDDPRLRKKDEEEEEVPEWDRYYSSVDRSPRDGDKENPYFKVSRVATCILNFVYLNMYFLITG